MPGEAALHFQYWFPFVLITWEQ